MERYSTEWRAAYSPKFDWWTGLSPAAVEELLQTETAKASAEKYPEFEIDVDDPEPVDWDELGGEFQPEQYGPLTVTVLKNYGGEGKGDTMELVFSLAYTDPDLGPVGGRRYFQKTGWYQSYSGGEWDGDLVEVRPEEQVVTVWREVGR